MKPDDKRGGLEDVGDAQSAPRAPKHSDLPSSFSALPARQLVDQWRALADEAGKQSDEVITQWVRETVYRRCAGQLAALLDPAHLSQGEVLDAQEPDKRLARIAEFCRLTARDGIAPSWAWFDETADQLVAVIGEMRRPKPALVDPAPPQEDLPAEAAKILRDHAWELYGDASLAPAPPETNGEELTRVAPLKAGDDGQDLPQSDHRK